TCADCQPEEGYRATRRILRHDGVTALLCMNDRLAFGAYQAPAEHRLSVPRDVSAIPLYDEELAAAPRPRLPTRAIPHQDSGALAIELLGADEPVASDVLVPMFVHERDSLGPPAR